MKNIRALISHPSCCWCVSAPYRIFSCTLTKFVLNVQSHEPSSLAHESSIDHNLLSRGNFSVKHSSFSLNKLSVITVIRTTFPVQISLCWGFLGGFGLFPCCFLAIHFCFWNSYEVFWMRRLNEKLTTFAKYNFPLTEKGKWIYFASYPDSLCCLSSPLLCVLSASLWFSWDPGNILVLAFRRSSAQRQ